MKVAFWCVVLAAVVGGGLTTLPIGVRLIGGAPTYDPLCGSHCLPAGATENPAITLIGE